MTATPCRPIPLRQTCDTPRRITQLLLLWWAHWYGVLAFGVYLNQGFASFYPAVISRTGCFIWLYCLFCAGLHLWFCVGCKRKARLAMWLGVAGLLASMATAHLAGIDGGALTLRMADWLPAATPGHEAEMRNSHVFALYASNYATLAVIPAGQWLLVAAGAIWRAAAHRSDGQYLGIAVVCAVAGGFFLDVRLGLFGLLAVPCGVFLSAIDIRRLNKLGERQPRRLWPGE